MKQLFKAFQTMSEQTAQLFTLGLVICDALLAAAAWLLLEAGPYSLSNYRVYIAAAELERAELGILFLVVFLTSFWEEQLRKSQPR